jgi:hypothetical protein
MAEHEKLQNWIEQIPDDIKPTVLALLNTVVGQGEQWITDWIQFVTAGQTAEAYQMAYTAMDEAGFLAQGEMISAAAEAANLDNATRIESQQAAIRQVLMALVTFGLTTLGGIVPLG